MMNVVVFLTVLVHEGATPSVFEDLLSFAYGRREKNETRGGPIEEEKIV